MKLVPTSCSKIVRLYTTFHIIMPQFRGPSASWNHRRSQGVYCQES